MGRMRWGRKSETVEDNLKTDKTYVQEMERAKEESRVDIRRTRREVVILLLAMLDLGLRT